MSIMKIKQFHFLTIFLLIFISLSSCSGLRQKATSRDINILLRKSVVFKNQFTGFVLYDPSTKKVVKERNGQLLFTPASNTKILTAYTVLKTLKDSIPTFISKLENDTIFIQPLGDPTFLHPDFKEQQAWSKLLNHPLKVSMPDKQFEHFGTGWAWDDYQYDFQQERSLFPVYGNEVRITRKEDSLQIFPPFFRNFVSLNQPEEIRPLPYRSEHSNIFNVPVEDDTSQFTRTIPFKTSEELPGVLLEDTLKNSVSLSKIQLLDGDTIYNYHLLPVLATMMQRSDNFLAEQLLIVSSQSVGNQNLDQFRNQTLSELNLPTKIRWVDGSGLSRYNLISPISMVKVLEEIYQMASWEEITSIFPNGGVSGTIRKWYGWSEPYVFAKTGTLSNNHALSGFIKTRSGRILIFSIMNNHYIRPVNEVKLEMQTLLELIRDGY